MKISLILETVDEELLRRVFEAKANGDDDALEALWEEAQEAVMDAVRSEFHPDLITLAL